MAIFYYARASVKHRETSVTYIVTVAHGHGAEWKMDSVNHWQECVCGNKAGIATHTDTNNDGKCDVCSYALPSDGGEFPSVSSGTTATPAQTTGATTVPAQSGGATTSPEMPTEPVDNGCGGCGGSSAKGSEPMLFGGALTAILGAVAGGKHFGKKRKTAPKKMIITEP